MIEVLGGNGAEKEIGITPEHIPEMLKEADAFVGNTGLTVDQKLSGIRAWIANFETVRAEFTRRADEFRAELDEADKEQEDTPERAKRNLEKMETCAEEWSRYSNAAVACGVAEIDLHRAEARLADPTMVNLAKVLCRNAWDTLHSYRTMASAERLIPLDDLENFRDQLKTLIRAIEALPAELVRETTPDLIPEAEKTLAFYREAWEKRGGGVKYKEGVGLTIDEEIKRPKGREVRP